MSKKIICNMCGKELDLLDRDQGFSVETTLGYGSIHDGDCICFDLCSVCIDKLIKSCKVTPVYSNVYDDWE